MLNILTNIIIKFIENMQNTNNSALIVRSYYICIYDCMYVCVCMYVCMHVCMYVCMHVCIEGICDPLTNNLLLRDAVIH